MESWTATTGSWADMVEEELMGEEVQCEAAVLPSAAVERLPTESSSDAEGTSWADMVEEELTMEEEVNSEAAVPSSTAVEGLPSESPSNANSEFWDWFYQAQTGECNPVAHPDASFSPPEGEEYYYSLSFDNYPQDFISTTPAAVSLWATTCFRVHHHQHWESGMPFTRQSIIAAQAVKTLTPVVYDGPGELLKSHHGSALQDALTGWVSKSYLPVGQVLHSPVDLEDPVLIHRPDQAHWSALTIGTPHLTKPYWYDGSDSDHYPSSLPSTGPSKTRKLVGRGSPLREATACYLAPDEVAPVTELKTLKVNTSFACESESSSEDGSPASTLPSPLFSSFPEAAEEQGDEAEHCSSGASNASNDAAMEAACTEDDEDDILDVYLSALDADTEYLSSSEVDADGAVVPQSGAAPESQILASDAKSAVEAVVDASFPTSSTWTAAGLIALSVVVGFGVSRWVAGRR